MTNGYDSKGIYRSNINNCLSFPIGLDISSVIKTTQFST